MKRESLTVGPWHFDVETHGPADGTPVLLLHGFPETAASWRPVGAALAARGLRAIAPNQRGYSAGARPLEVAEYAMPRLVEDVLGMLDALGLAQVDLVGHDWGAFVAWAVAAGHPDRIRSLTALSTPHPAAFARARSHDGEQREKSSYIQLFQQEDAAAMFLADDAVRLRGAFGPEVPGELIEAHLDVLTKPGAFDSALNWYRAMGRYPGDAAPVRVPTTYIWGARDEAIGRQAAQACGDLVDAPYRFLELAEAGHWLSEAESELVAAEVLVRVETSALR